LRARVGLICGLLACAGRTTPVTAPALPVDAAVRDFYAFVDHLDLADPRYRFVAKHGEGTSCYLMLKRPGSDRGDRIWGAIVPEHCGTVIDAEIFAHTLASVVGVAGLEGPARRMRLDGAARARVVAALQAEDYSHDNHYRQDNVRDFLAYAARGGPIAAVAKVWGPAPHDADFMLKGEAFDRDQPLARFLRADEPQPGESPMTFPGIPGEASERSLARELSSLFVMDALLNQRDRFTGGNLQLISVPEGGARRLHFIGYDNGDALDDPDPKWIRRYFDLVSRFDHRLVDRLAELDAFLAGRRPRFGDFRSVAELRRALDVPSSDEWRLFTRNLGLLLAHVATAGPDRFFAD
jgi:hypothetical protein